MRQASGSKSSRPRSDSQRRNASPAPARALEHVSRDLPGGLPPVGYSDRSSASRGPIWSRSARQAATSIFRSM